MFSNIDSLAFANVQNNDLFHKSKSSANQVSIFFLQSQLKSTPQK
jgi:hypothetical protein